MGIHAGHSLLLLAATVWLLLVSPSEAVSTRQEAQQLRGSTGRSSDEAKLQRAKDSENDDDDDDDDEEDDEGKESAEEKAADKAREEMKAKLEKSVKLAKAKLQKNRDEQEEINMQIRDFENVGGSAVIRANVKAVNNETESSTVGTYLGDMWKEMREFSTPFYQEHIMEIRAHLERKASGLEKRYKAEALRLKEQKLEWAKQDAQDDAKDEADPEKKKEDLKKVAKLRKEEKHVEKEEEELGIFSKPPWMRNQKEAEPTEEKEAEPAADPAMTPDWMRSLEAAGVKPSHAKGRVERVHEAVSDKAEEEPKKKAKAAKDDAGDEDDDDEEEEPQKKTKEPKEEVKDEKKTESGDEKKDDEGLDILGKPPWMNDKEKKEEKKPASPKKKKKPAEDNSVKPDWMKSLEGSDSDESDDEDSEDKKASVAQVDEEKKSKKKKATKVDDEDEEEEEVPVAPGGKHKPMFTEKTMPQVSPTVQCVISLAWQFFIVYTAMALLRTVNQVSQNRFASCVRAQELVGMVMPFVMFAPMLSVLFLATRMRAIQLAQGDTEKYELPQPWVQLAMYTATYGVMGQAIFKLLTFMLSYRVLPDGSAVATRAESRFSVMFFTLLNFVFMGAIYVGFTAVCIGAIIMPAPKELWGDDPPQVSASLLCIMMLTTTFFAIYLGLCLFRTVEELRPRLLDDFNTLVKVQLLFWRARHAVNMAPMLCVLFIVTRMRALQMDPKNGNPPYYAQVGMYCCTGAMVFQVAASIILPLIDRNAYILPGPVQGQIILVMSIHPLRIIGDLMRYIPLLCVYGGAGTIVYSVFHMKAPDGQATPEISATMRCVIGLTTLYFTVFTAVYVAQTIADRLHDGRFVKTMLTVLDAGQRTVMLAPMLCILFIAARMRALQLTRTVDGKIPAGAGPQHWVQDGMYASAGAVFLQVMMAYLVTFFLGPGHVQEDDAQKEDPHEPKSTSPDEASNALASQNAAKSERTLSPSWAVGVSLNVMNFLGLIAMYGGVVAVMVGTVTMTPETLPPYNKGSSVVESYLLKFL